MKTPGEELHPAAAVWAAGALITGIVVFVVYLPSLKNGFVNYDDYIYVSEALYSRPMNAAFLRWAFTAVVVSHWHPFTLLSYKLDYSLWGMNPMGYHLTSIVLHALNTALVFLLAARLFSLKPPGRASFGRTQAVTALAAAGVALLFGLHPLRVESVSWISERKDVLYSSFFLLSLLSYLRYAVAHEKTRRRSYIASLVFFAAALLSKPMAVTLPAVLLILDCYPLDRAVASANRGRLKHLIIEKVPFFVLSALSAAATLWAGTRSGALTSIGEYPLSMRIIVPVKSYAFHLYKTVLPVALAPLYPQPEPGFLKVGFLAPLAFLVLITLLCVAVARRRKVFPAVWAYYLVTLLPVTGVLQIGAQAAADRYTYLTTLGFFMLAGAVAIGRAGRFGRGGKAVLLVVFAAAICASVVLNVRQQAVWKDSLSLHDHQVRTHPDSFRSYLNRGLVYEKRGDYAKAVKDYNRAISLNPAYPYTYIDRGITYGKLGMLDRSVEDLSTAIRLKPDYAKAWYYRAVARYRQGRLDDAVADLSKAISIDPENAVLYRRRAEALKDLGRTKESLADYEKVAELYPVAGAYLELGLALLDSGDRVGGIRNLERASKMGSSRAREHLKGLQ